MWHPVWVKLVDVWHLTGAWLHPETLLCLDQMAFTEERVYLFIGCRDRHRSPLSHDQEVIAFRLCTFRGLEVYEQGHGFEASMLLYAGTAVAESTVHEALEMHRSSPGVPVLDPHTAGLTVTVTVHWANPDLSTTRTTHASA
ncbi:hypothetical protein [Streptomyces sp. MMBL 11-3]|uniref:hypothetical protein n=1 Tax=Streptomyces sp. MMBL 11-3 TaxID=3382639 RepID=UPI0039B6A158